MLSGIVVFSRFVNRHQSRLLIEPVSEPPEPGIKAVRVHLERLSRFFHRAVSSKCLIRVRYEFLLFLTQHVVTSLLRHHSLRSEYHHVYYCHSLRSCQGVFASFFAFFFRVLYSGIHEVIIDAR